MAASATWKVDFGLLYAMQEIACWKDTITAVGDSFQRTIYQMTFALDKPQT
jgi:hypothetical protein